VQFFQGFSDGAPLPVTVSASALVEYHVDFVLHDGDWRIHSLRILPIFQGHV
jgi:hypothetical protein